MTTYILFRTFARGVFACGSIVLFLLWSIVASEAGKQCSAKMLNSVLATKSSSTAHGSVLECGTVGQAKGYLTLLCSMCITRVRIDSIGMRVQYIIMACAHARHGVIQGLAYDFA